jgi:DNA-binding SARP family transcriptional activator
MNFITWMCSVVNDQELHIEIRLLGSFEVRRRDDVIQADDWPRKKAAALLKRLALERRLLKDQAIEFLWPEADPASAANNLYKTLHVIRQVLDAALGPGVSEATFRYEDGILSLLPSVWVDALEFERLCAVRVNISSEQRVAEIIEGLDLYRVICCPMTGTKSGH